MKKEQIGRSDKKIGCSAEECEESRENSEVAPEAGGKRRLMKI